MCFFKKNPKPIGEQFNYSGYHKVFSENFTTPIDWNKWTWEYPGGQDQKEKTKWVQECTVQDSNGLHLIAKKGDGVNLCGQLCSFKFLETLYGYITFTAKMPPNGLLYFPALWGYNKMGWQPEIDIVELAGGQSNELWFTYHWDNNGSDVAVGTHLKWEKTNFDQGFHEYAVEWTPSYITWYVDKMPYYKISENIPTVPIFWIMGIQAGYGPPFTHLFTDSESGKSVDIKLFEIWQK